MVEPQASVWTLFDEKAAASTSIRNDFSDAMLEVRSYLEQLHIQRGGDPLNWWKAKSAIYPRLTKIMERKLCIVGTSVPSERVFSKTGLIVSERRNRISPPKVRQLAFLNANLP